LVERLIFGQGGQSARHTFSVRLDLSGFGDWFWSRIAGRGSLMRWLFFRFF